MAQPLALVGSQVMKPCEPHRRQAAGDGYKPRTEPIVLHRRK